MAERWQILREMSNRVKSMVGVANPTNEASEDSVFDAVVDEGGKLVIIEREGTQPVVPESPVLGVPRETTRRKWEGATRVSPRTGQTRPPIGGAQDD